MEGNSYEEMAEDLGCDTKTIDNALQRVKRKVLHAPGIPPGPLVGAGLARPAGLQSRAYNPSATPV